MKHVWKEERVFGLILISLFCLLESGSYDTSCEHGAQPPAQQTLRSRGRGGCPAPPIPRLPMAPRAGLPAAGRGQGRTGNARSARSFPALPAAPARPRFRGWHRRPVTERGRTRGMISFSPRFWVRSASFPSPSLNALCLPNITQNVWEGLGVSCVAGRVCIASWKGLYPPIQKGEVPMRKLLLLILAVGLLIQNVTSSLLSRIRGFWDHKETTPQWCYCLQIPTGSWCSHQSRGATAAPITLWQCVQGPNHTCLSWQVLLGSRWLAQTAPVPQHSVNTLIRHGKASTHEALRLHCS